MNSILVALSLYALLLFAVVWLVKWMTQSVMDRLLTAGLCGNTLGQDIQTLTYHSSTSNMAFHLKDVCSSNFRGRSHIAPKNVWKTLGALLSPFFQSARAVALRRRLSLLSNHQLRSPLQEGHFVTWPAVRLRHSEKFRCFYLDAPGKRRARRFHYVRAYRASTFEITNLSAQKTRYLSSPLHGRSIWC